MKKEKDTLYGAFEIACYLGFRKDYVTFSNLLRFCGVPHTKPDRGPKVYYMTKKQAKEFYKAVKNLRTIFEQKVGE